MWLKVSRKKATPFAQLTDEELLTAFAHTQNLEALSTAYGRYLTQVTGVCLKYLKTEEAAKDAVMEIFEELSGKISRYEIGHFKSWLYTYCRNFCLMRLRKENRLPKHLSIDEPFMENAPAKHLHNQHLPEEALLTQELLLPQALAELSLEQKQCVELFFFQEKSYQEIELLTGYPLKKVKSYLQNGKRNLKIWFDKNAKEI